MLELFVDPIMAFIIYLVGSAVFFIIGVVISGKKSNSRILFSAIFMTLSVFCLVLTLNNTKGDNNSLNFLIPLGAAVWGFVCLQVVVEQQNKKQNE